MITTGEDRDPAILPFLVTASSLALLGLESAFWGIIAGFTGLAATRIFRRRARLRPIR